MGLVLKVKPSQRIFIGDELTLEATITGGQIMMHFIASPPFAFDIKRECTKLFNDRMKSGGINGTQERHEIRCMHKKK